MGGSDPTAPQNRGPVPSGFGGHSRLKLLRKSQPVFWPRGAGSSNGFVRQDVRQTVKEEQKESMAIIKAPFKQPKSVTIQARVEESVKIRLDQYAKFIDSTPSYVITEALKILFKRDDEFKTWLCQHANVGNHHKPEGGILNKSA
jgi:predicted transcriptional regulator